MADNKKEQIKADYAKTAFVYDKRYEEIQKEKYEVVFAKIKNLKPREGLMLDHGCGTGLFQKFLDEKKVNIKLIGIDIVFDMIKKAKEAGELVAVADADFLPFESETFSMLFSFTVLQNLPDPEVTLTEIRRVMIPDGLIVLTYLKKSNPTIAQLIERDFNVKEKFECGEDICFILGCV